MMVRRAPVTGGLAGGLAGGVAVLGISPTRPPPGETTETMTADTRIEKLDQLYNIRWGAGPGLAREGARGRVGHVNRK